MSARGVWGDTCVDGVCTDCLVIGFGVPNMHMADSIPVYQVIEHELGKEFELYHGRLKVKLLAYPVHWPAPGLRTKGKMLFTNMEAVPWAGRMIPVFDGEPDQEGGKQS